jgi:hypothetical protein
VTADGRIAAWLRAWQYLDRIEEERRRFAERRNEMPAGYADQLLSTATIYARLAQADMAVGMAAGEWLREQEKSRIDEANRVAAAMATFGEKMTPTTEGDEE